jgi:hypothetical protein
MIRRPRWYVLAALAALGQHRSGDTTATFTAGDLLRWVPRYPGAGYAELAISGLVVRKEIERAGDSAKRPSSIRPVFAWRLTQTGAVTARAAYMADRARNPLDYGNPPSEPVDPFAARVWSLLRIRRAMTADEAASSLADAGDDIAAVRSRIGALLLAGSRIFPEALQVSAKRVDGFKRYVLLNELGPTPPSIRAKKPSKA